MSINNTTSLESEKQIEQEAIKYESWTEHEGLGPGIYKDGANKYGLKWEQAEAMIEKMAKALEGIRDMKIPMSEAEFRQYVAFAQADAIKALADYSTYKNCKDGNKNI